MRSVMMTAYNLCSSQQQTETPAATCAELLFIDPGVADVATIFATLRPGIKAVLLEATRPAAAQIAEALAGHRDLAAIHVMAHGAPGRVLFSAGEWSSSTLALYT